MSVSNSRHAPECIPVHLGQRTYDILVSSNGIQQIGCAIRDRKLGRKEAIVFTSPTIGRLYFVPLEQALKAAGFERIARHDIPDGEENKNFKEYERCLDALMRNFPEPGAIPLVVNLGGGVVSDMGGFAAGTFRRGVPYVQVPTTVLGCVDCGVGGKVGVNHNKVKNIIGLFYQPRLVFADLSVLTTLSAREVRSGVAEIIKYGVVCNNAFFAYLEQNIEKLIALEPEVLKCVVSECYRIKAHVVERDELDNRGERIVLNYGHTIGHALEMAVEPRITHGEAIAIGMVGAARLAGRLGFFQQDGYDRTRNLLKRAGLPTSTQEYKVDMDRVLESIQYDKKSVSGTLRFVLPTAIGKWRAEDIDDLNLVREIISSCLSDA